VSLRAGMLNRRLAIQSRSTTQDAAGQPLNTWTTLATVWAAIEPLSGHELERAQAIHPEISHQITIRYAAAWADPKTVAKYRGLYKSRIFNFHAPMNSEEGNVQIVILASEGLNQG
jgi:SPP1 family predicted phage head-tail adaptor